MPHLFMPLIGLSILAINVQPHFDVRFSTENGYVCQSLIADSPTVPQNPAPSYAGCQDPDHAYQFRGVMSLERMQHASNLSHFPFAGLYLKSPFSSLKVTLSSQSLQQPDPLRLGKTMAVWTSCRHVTSCFPMP